MCHDGFCLAAEKSATNWNCLGYYMKDHPGSATIVDGWNPASTSWAWQCISLFVLYLLDILWLSFCSGVLFTIKQYYQKQTKCLPQQIIISIDLVRKQRRGDTPLKNQHMPWTLMVWKMNLPVKMVPFLKDMWICRQGFGGGAVLHMSQIPNFQLKKKIPKSPPSWWVQSQLDQDIELRHLTFHSKAPMNPRRSRMGKCEVNRYGRYGWGLKRLEIGDRDGKLVGKVDFWVQLLEKFSCFLF